MIDGFVDFWSTKGFGFIHTDDGRSYFAHITSFTPVPAQMPVKGLLVSFEEGRATKGPVALNIRIRHAQPKMVELARVTSSGGAE